MLPAATPASIEERRRAAMAFACDALRSQRSPSSSAMSCAEMKRIFEASCMFILRR